MALELQNRSAWWRGNHYFRDETCGPAEKTSLMSLVPASVREDPSVGHFWKEDFMVFDATNDPIWKLTEDAGKTGTDVVNDELGGWYKHFADGDDNDESYVITTVEAFKLSASKYMWWEARVRLTEGNTNTANFIVGLSEAVGANHLLDNGGGPPANYDGVVWYKPDATMSLSFETSLAAAQVTSAGLLAHVSGHVYRLGAFIKPASATTFTVFPYYVDETALAAGTAQTYLDSANTHALTLAGHGEMEAFFGVKQGATSTEEYIEIDYFWVAQQR